MEAHADEADAARDAQAAQQRQVASHLATGLVDGAKWRPGELELPARLQGDGAVVAKQRDGPATILHARPAAAAPLVGILGDGLEERLDALGTLEGQRPVIGAQKAELLVLGAHPETSARLLRGAEVVDQLVDATEGRAGIVVGVGQHSAHGPSISLGPTNPLGRARQRRDRLRQTRFPGKLGPWHRHCPT